MQSLTTLPAIEQLSARVIRILGCNPSPLTLQGTNTYLIGNGPKRILLDTSGSSTVNWSEYLSNLTRELDKQKLSLQEILISHWHPDHTDGVQHIFREVVKDNNLRVSKHRLCDMTEHDQVTVYTYIEDNHLIKTDGATLRAIFTPGHSQDHLCFHLEEENSLFSGDCILGETSAEFEDLYDYMNSLKKILVLAPNVIYPGHGPVVKNAKERIQTYINHRNQRNDQILECLKAQALTADKLVKQIYINLDKSLIPAATYNVNNHLSYLIKHKIVEELDGCKYKLMNKE